MKITKSEYVKGGTLIKHFPIDNWPEFLFCGRSNVGKSSFINALLNHNIARTSSKPGKTQAINFFNINDAFYFVDVPGYGYAAVDKSTLSSFGAMLEEYITKRQNLKCAFLLVDFRHDPTEDDITMHEFLKHYNENVFVIATKKDKVKRSEFFKKKKAILASLNISEEDLIITSSETKEGMEEVFKKIEQFL